MLLENWVSFLSIMIGLGLAGTLVLSVVLYIQYKRQGGSKPAESAAHSIAIEPPVPHAAPGPETQRRRISFG